MGFIGYIERLAIPTSATRPAHVRLLAGRARERCFARTRHLHSAPSRERFRRRTIHHQSGKAHRKVTRYQVSIFKVLADHRVLASWKPIFDLRRQAGDFANLPEVRHALKITRIMPPEKSALFYGIDCGHHVGDPSFPSYCLETPFQGTLHVRKRVTALQSIANGANGTVYLSHLPSGFAMTGRNRITVTRHFGRSGESPDSVK